MKDEEWLQEQQIALDDVVGAYGYNMCAACPSLGGQYFPLNVLPMLLLLRHERWPPRMLWLLRRRCAAFRQGRRELGLSQPRPAQPI